MSTVEVIATINSFKMDERYDPLYVGAAENRAASFALEIAEEVTEVCGRAVKQDIEGQLLFLLENNAHFNFDEALNIAITKWSEDNENI